MNQVCPRPRTSHRIFVHGRAEGWFADSWRCSGAASLRGKSEKWGHGGAIIKNLDTLLTRVGIDRDVGSEHNYMYVNPAEV